MFCAKCGLKILANQQFCPNCGAKNENYSGEKKRRIIPLSAAIVVVLGIAGSIFLLRKNSSSLSIHNEYVKRGAVGYVSAEGNASFLIDGDRVKFSGGIVTARTSPDYSKYIILNDSGELLLYINPEGASQKIAENVYEISEVNNQGVFIKEKSAERLKFYYFDGKKEFDTGFDGDYTIQYSANGMSVAGLDAEGELYIYTVGNDSVNNLGKAGEEIELCAVADSGENVIWSDEKDQNICVYMMQNGAQERIGKLGKPEQYHSVYAYFFDDGKSFIVYSAKAGKMLLSIDCEYPREINIAGVKGYGGIMDQDGRPIYSEESKIESFYFASLDHKDTEIGSLYHMSLDGTLTEVVSNIDTSINWDYWEASNYYFVDGRVFYLDKDGDFFVKKEAGSDSERITTDVDAIYASANGKYVYLIKSGTLYYWDSSDGEHKLNVIKTEFTPDDTVYLTERDEVIYYITGTADIKYSDGSKMKDTYSDKGTLNKFTIGGENEKISDDIMGLQLNDFERISSKHQVIRKYIEMNGASIVEEIGTVINGTYAAVSENKGSHEGSNII